MPPYAFRPGDWVSDCGERVARVKSVYHDRSGVLLDLVMYDRAGNKLGRISPPLGGPRTFEPACPGTEWRRVKEPDFPMVVQWVSDGQRRVMKYWAGESLPPANWTPPKRTRRFVARPSDDRLRQALKQIADGHNDARQLAKDVLSNSS